ncbi:ATP-binding protein [Bowdeniella nasicola]|uniref:ATP-binding protein n=1 Tax=Bowdeniella nasicola TaxID=208480 RepID=A0A1Q5Q2P3_9ACTO|nr:PhoH family protein [Bowdeniella nasicola]OKL53890.1 ATP-binding protein [Bowdeniella nasicola]
MTSTPVIERREGVRTYLIDTSVLLSDPLALTRFAEHDVVLPIIVVTELEAKRSHPELGYYARQALHALDDLRVEHGRLDRPVPSGDGGRLWVDLEHEKSSALPSGLQLGDNDSRILSVAAQLAADGHDVIVVSKDLPMRVKASAVGLASEEYLAQQVIESGWTGMARAELTEEEMSQLWEHGELEFDSLLSGDELAEQPVHTGVILTSARGSALGTVNSDGKLRVIRTDREIFGVRGRSAEQRVAIEHLMNDEIGILSLGGRAGTGKSALALAAGLELTLEQRKYRKIMVFRPLYAVGGQQLGYLPGSEAEKMDPWGQAVFDTLSAVVSQEVTDEVASRGLLEILPLTHIRGRTLHDAFVIVDEAQSLERNVLLTVLSRVGQNAKVILTHDIAQRDNLRVGRHDGVVAVIEKLKNHKLFAHVTLTKSERSEISDLVTSMLD